MVKVGARKSLFGQDMEKLRMKEVINVMVYSSFSIFKYIY